jgi:Mn-dependent DtxR family transcriptional regulator
MPQSPYVTTAEIASALRVHPTTVQTWWREGIVLEKLHEDDCEPATFR